MWRLWNKLFGWHYVSFGKGCCWGNVTSWVEWHIARVRIKNDRVRWMFKKAPFVFDIYGEEMEAPGWSRRVVPLTFDWREREIKNED